MSTSTTNLGLTKPTDLEDADIADINGNMDIIDAAVGDVDVSTDGSLQSQVSAVRDSVSSLSNSVSVSGSLVKIGFLTASNGMPVMQFYRGATERYQLYFGNDGLSLEYINANGQVTSLWTNH